MNPFDLTDAQKRKFTALKKAYEACKKEGIMFVNVYGTLQAYNSKMVSEYADNSSLDINDEDTFRANSRSEDTECLNYFNIVCEWTDDPHLIKLTPKGLKAYKEYNS